MTTPKIGPSDKAGLSDIPSSAQRTAGPWKVGGKSFEWNSPSSPRIDLVKEIEGSRSVYVIGHVCYPTTTGDTVGAAEREANAAFIVKACNAHDELLAALQLADHYNSCFDGKDGQIIRAVLATLS